MYVSEFNAEVSVERYIATKSLLTAIARHDLDTLWHLFQVASLSDAIARAMGLSEREVNIVVDGALYHDVGKMRVPASILRAPRALSEVEWAAIREHPAHGANMLRKIGGVPKEVIQVAAMHHERLDGSGYPDGLRGEQIPLAVRIVALADTFDVMRAGRLYRKPRSTGDVLDELSTLVGSAYDPAAFAALANIALLAPAATPEPEVRHTNGRAVSGTCK